MIHNPDLHKPRPLRKSEADKPTIQRKIEKQIRYQTRKEARQAISRASGLCGTVTREML